MTVDIYAIARGCAGKTRYRSPEVARAVVVAAEHDRGERLRVYTCETCGGWHLTHLRVEPAREGLRPARISARSAAYERQRRRRR